MPSSDLISLKVSICSFSNKTGNKLCYIGVGIGNNPIKPPIPSFSTITGSWNTFFNPRINRPGFYREFARGSTI